MSIDSLLDDDVSRQLVSGYSDGEWKGPRLLRGKYDDRSTLRRSNQVDDSIPGIVINLVQLVFQKVTRHAFIREHIVWF